MSSSDECRGDIQTNIDHLLPVRIPHEVIIDFSPLRSRHGATHGRDVVEGSPQSLQDFPINVAYFFDEMQTELRKAFRHMCRQMKGAHCKHQSLLIDVLWQAKFLGPLLDPGPEVLTVLTVDIVYVQCTGKSTCSIGEGSCL